MDDVPRLTSTSTGSAASGQTSQEKVDGPPPSISGGPEAQASRTTRAFPFAPPGATRPTPRAEGWPPTTETVSRCGRSGWGTFRPTADQAGPEPSSGGRTTGSSSRLIQPRSRSRRVSSTTAASGIRQDSPDPADRPEADGRWPRARERSIESTGSSAGPRWGFAGAGFAFGSTTASVARRVAAPEAEAGGLRLRRSRPIRDPSPVAAGSQLARTSRVYSPSAGGAGTFRSQAVGSGESLATSARASCCQATAPVRADFSSTV